jgi:hypothetical protein
MERDISVPGGLGGPPARRGIIVQACCDARLLQTSVAQRFRDPRHPVPNKRCGCGIATDGRASDRGYVEILEGLEDPNQSRNALA